ncbi:hypothetical protein EQG49_08385 [Periweissella cryptocerci]|uniref:Uncharacterized protein n=1 Tax=Periweissella cryptocerci TaxID=2506420 RepID=A0A4P6YUV9_9LACO|nr:hypothetical protein [Periweissella cryptocerci]QBO36487.1 hypothetical protein EQG49_08385 [Periweissella cryptocerci]
MGMPIYTAKGQFWLDFGLLWQQNPQLVLDNVNYIQKRVFVSHINFGGGVNRQVHLLVQTPSVYYLPKYLNAVAPNELLNELAAIKNIMILGVGENLPVDFKLVDNPNLPTFERVDLLKNLELSAAAVVQQHNDDLVKIVGNLSQRKMNHYFSPKERYDNLKDFLLMVTPYLSLVPERQALRNDEWRLKIPLGGH